MDMSKILRQVVRQALCQSRALRKDTLKMWRDFSRKTGIRIGTYIQCAVLKLRCAVSRTARRVLLRAGSLAFRLDYWPGLVQRGSFGSLHLATPPLILQVTANFHFIRYN